MKKNFIVALVAMLSVMVVMPGIVAAESPSPIDVTGVFDTVTSQVTSSITAVLPYAAVILAAMLAITLGLKIYRRVTGR